MAIKTGRNGSVKYNPLGATSPGALVALIGLNAWKLSLKTDFEEVTQFGDSNKVYVPGMRDISGSLSGFFDAADLTIISATDQDTPGQLQLITNVNDTVPGTSPLVAPTFTGLAYLDADIDASLMVPKISASFRAAGAWALPA